MTNRWGTSSCTPNPEKTVNTKETEEKLKKMMADRLAQDNLFNRNPTK